MRANVASAALLTFAGVAFAACGTTIYVGAGGAGNTTTTTVGSTGNGAAPVVGPGAGPGAGAGPITVGPGVGAGPTTGPGTSTGVGGGPTYPCTPGGLCAAVDKDCLGYVDNAGLTKFGLRMSDLVVASPGALAKGIVAMVLTPAIQQNDIACNEPGQGTFNWLLEFDLNAGTLKAGGARPIMDPQQLNYIFDTEILAGKMIAPVTYMSQFSAMGTGLGFAVTQGQALNMPIFLDQMGTNAVVLPLRQATFKGQLSANHDCIGSFNAKGLDPTNACLPDATHPLFIDGASLDALITLEDADQVPVTAIGETLCVLLAGDPANFGAPGTGMFAGLTVCKRDASNAILYKGGWCSTTNQPATPTCADAEHLSGSFAASSVLIKG
jgi:hypothetical protein